MEKEIDESKQGQSLVLEIKNKNTKRIQKITKKMVYTTRWKNWKIYVQRR